MAVSDVSVRELRQNLSVYLERVRHGETFSVTRRGEPVAVLGPRQEGVSALDRVVAEGRATPARGDVLDLGPPPKARPEARPLSEILDELREDRL